MLTAAAEQQPLPDTLTKAHSALSAAHAALQSAVVDQLGHAAPANEPALAELDRILDNCWGGLDDRLQGLSRLPASVAGSVEAAALRKRLFPDGLSFLKLNARLQWSESQTRLELIEKEALGPTLTELAGPPFLPAILDAHAHYGKALGMTEALKSAAPTPLVRGALDTFLAALRTYIVKVIAAVDPDLPDTQTTADALLTPFAAWTVPAKGSSKPDTPAPPATPADAPDAPPA